MNENNGYTAIELFAGCGGLALGLEQSGFKSVLLSELNKDACATLRKNRPEWNVVQGDVSKLDFTPYRDRVDMVSGGFPCQPFSYAWKQLGFEDVRGTLFFEYARAVKEVNPKVFVAENVRGLVNHDGGKTLEVIRTVLTGLGYTLVEPTVLKAVNYMVPQKRERLIIVGIRNDIYDKAVFEWPEQYHRILTLQDALKAGVLYDTDVPASVGQTYTDKKKAVLDLVPAGGNWTNLPHDLQISYMEGAYHQSGGKTGFARRISWDEPCLTLTCSPAQKQTERCHPDETRPFQVREYARIQTFPDNWEFFGSMSAVYKQIGNAVPVNLSKAVGASLVRFLDAVK